ncbi:restriction endonuclease subunit S [Maritimibacter sp. HL-12]|uniref:restriction endonuclease subunit S n=1 Tax=Maritimibacter sp. HL-12 TaxID=1162418 RepID=UPI000A0F3CB2|nr:restriction endonuclease subunit S [Maritimibacter sp. HL-12]SMH50829.1 type I restriction enzyme, S subunit [Maritimibacter sp. HL-12]
MDLRPGYKQTEIGPIPEDWDAVPLGDLFTFKNGLNKAKKYFGYGTPIVNYMDVFRQPGLRLDRIEGRVDVSKSELEAFEVRKGDVFFTRTSETVEEIGVAAAMLDQAHNTVFSGFVLRARPTNDMLDDLFKAYCFAPRYFRRQVVARATYTTRALTNGRSLSAAFLVVPPIWEQRAIAEALADLDETIAALSSLLAKKRVLRSAAGRRMLTGEFRLPGFDEEWSTLEAREIGAFKGGSGFPLSAQGEVSGDYPFLKVSDMNLEGNETFISTANHYISEETRKRVGATPFPAGSIIFAKVGAAVFLERKKILSQASCIDNNMGAFSLNTKIVDVAYVHSLLLTIKLGAIVSTTALPALNSKHLGDLLLAIPPIEEQRAIAAVLADMDSEITSLDARLEKTKALKQGVMQALLTGRVRLPVKGEKLGALEVAHA